MLSSGPAMAFVLETSQQLWLSAQDPANQNFSLGEGGVFQALPFTQELLAIPAGVGVSLFFFLEAVVSLVGFPCSSGWPHSHTHMTSTKWT